MKLKNSLQYSCVCVYCGVLLLVKGGFRHVAHYFL